MPFDEFGEYIEVNNSVHEAVNGTVIDAGAFNEFMADVLTALTSLGRRVMQAPQSRSGSFSVGQDDSVLLIDASAPTITLPQAISKSGPVTIIGSGTGIFATYNSTLVCYGAETINGQPTFLLRGDKQAITLIPIVGGWRIA